MTLNQALALIRENPRDGTSRQHFLACGFQPVHLSTFLEASLIERYPRSRATILTGLYGDFEGNLERALKSSATEGSVVVEWSDIDPRLGVRAAGGWLEASKKDVLDTARQRFERIAGAIEKIGKRLPVVVATPGLPLPPIGNTIGAQASRVELDLEEQLAAFRLHIGSAPGVRLLNSFAASHLGGGESRLDAKMELLSGFPYTISYAAALARALVEVLHQPAPKKGLITDLDDTLWCGIIGEVGPEGIHWHQERHSQVHGLFQQMLGHLAECGVLLAVCSKNEPSVAEAGLAREDLLLKPGSLFPVCASWGPKSKSVAEILRVWNIAADAVVFVDDNPMEVSEVQQAYPEMTCLQFPRKDVSKVWMLLHQLRDLFGKPVVLEEDRLRAASLQAAAKLGDIQGEAAPEFLRGLDGCITMDYSSAASDPRALELINKTNQFNLNGVRVTLGEWTRCLEQSGSIAVTVSYRDKFGPLGKIAVLAATERPDCVEISHWVMSCRAFSRRVEHHLLERLFQRTGGKDIEFLFQETDRNQPLREFFRSVGVRQNGSGVYRLSRAEFAARCDWLPHRISELPV